MQPSVILVFHFFVSTSPSIIQINLSGHKIRIFNYDSLKSVHTVQI